MDWIPDAEVIGAIFGSAMQSQVTQFGIAFSIAAWIHSGRVKKEIAQQLSGIKEVMVDLAAALREELKKESERISRLEDRMSKIDSNKTTERSW